MSKRLKKIGLIIIALLFLASVITVLIPLIMGISHGFDGGEIEIKIRDNCNCKTVSFDDGSSIPESTTDYYTGKITKKFNIKLMDCEYESFESLSQDILTIVKKDDLCSGKNIEISVNNSGKERTFVIADCSIKD
ncbi:MAG: hypothetical protein ACTIJ9_13860 [Aequorivita sp.]